MVALKYGFLYNELAVKSSYYH